ncbi:flagellar basal body-associated FliL family protein [Nocardioides pantholopis]|uniref:flagellar basal body-associated FliL family protein n=1 Tax=Nocardioides pantholopis TaxID=2483798 RepID=UPI000F078AD1|nr:flagellar basal body-associated FliL family protein [Nocardioides pantholopis]
MSTTTLSPPQAAPAAEDEQPTGRKKKLLIVLVALLLLGGAGYWFFLKPSGEAEAVPGEVVALDPVQVNLADGHYLSVGIALQLVEGAHEVEGSKALDATIDMFSGQSVPTLTDPETRRKMKASLTHELAELYHEEVLEVYFTQFVTQ